ASDLLHAWPGGVRRPAAESRSQCPSAGDGWPVDSPEPAILIVTIARPAGARICRMWRGAHAGGVIRPFDYLRTIRTPGRRHPVAGTLRVPPAADGARSVPIFVHG